MSRWRSGVGEVRRVITGLTWPQGDIAVRLASPDFPGPLLRDPDLARITRRLGGAIAPYGVPLTAAGWGRVRRWRREWLALPCRVVPVVVGLDRVVRPGAGGVRYLAEAAGPAGAVAAGPGTGGGHQLVNF